VRTIAVSGLVVLAAALGGVAVPVAAMARPTTAVAQPTTAAARLTIAGRLAATERLTTAERLTTGEPLISCVLATDCLGVEGSSGLSDDGTSTPTRVAHWNGSAWRGVGVALPKGTKSVDLNGVSCKGAKSCLVVGDYYTSTSANATAHALTAFYNGTSLKALPAVTLPKGTTDAAFGSVSCATTRYCVAIGMAQGDTAAFGKEGMLNILETWNGAKWTLHTIATTIGKTTSVEPIEVSCATTAFCVLAGEAVPIVGSGSPSSATFAIYAASWNGRKLTTMKPAPVSSGAVFPLATGVSCATASNCAITGAYLGGVISSSSEPAFTAFTEIWNGKAWRLGTVVWPKGTVQSLDLGVSCYAAHSCEAVGLDGTSTADNAPAYATAVSFNGTAGTVQAVPAPAKGHSTAFTAVSCLTGGRCLAAGETGKTTASTPAVMTGVLSGKAWKLDPGF
jgi:hypothetical protein